MILARYEVFKVTEYRGGAIYKTRKVCDVWIQLGKLGNRDEQIEIAKQNGGDILVNTLDTKTINC
jgi:hypothetical protein